MAENHGLDPEDENRVDFGEDAFAEARCSQTALKAAHFLDKVAKLPAAASAHLPAVQVAALLLRTNPPELTAAAARDFDEAVLKA